MAHPPDTSRGRAPLAALAKARCAWPRWDWVVVVVLLLLLCRAWQDCLPLLVHHQR